MNHFIILILSFLFIPLSALGFVENVTHGYPSCIACHYSPTGGDMLTDYGRSLSSELMSTWSGYKGMEEPLFGAVKNTENIKLGGDFRRIQTWLDNDQVSQGSSFVMQSNFELGLIYDKVMFVGALGVQEGPDNFPRRGQFLSERHYVLWETSPTSRLRAGKFRLRYGINDPNHNRLIKRLFNFGYLSEAYNLEYTHYNQNYEVSVSSSAGRIDNPRVNSSEKALTTSFVHYLGGESRLGGSVLLGESTTKRRFLSGLFGVLKFSEHWLGEFELDRETAHFASSVSDEVETVASLLKLGHKTFKGFFWYALFEHSTQNSVSGHTGSHAPGIGIQWLPVPHLEIQLEYQRSVVSGSSGNPNHVGFLMFHMYPF